MSKEDVFRNIKGNIALENFKKEAKKQRKINVLVQSIFTLIICAISISGIVFAKEISIKLYENFYLTGKGIEKAMNEGYIADTNMGYENSNVTVENEETGEVIEDSEIQIKVDEFIMDDFSLSLTFDVNLSEKSNKIITAGEVYRINFPDLVVSDENNVVLYCLTGQRFNEFCKENNLNYNYDTATNEQYIGSGVNIFAASKNGNNLKLIYNIYTGGDCTYPKSKKLRFQMNKIKVSKEAATMGGEEITFTGDWDFEINVPEKIYNRQTIVYTQKETTNQDYRVIGATLYNTGMKITLETKTEKQPKRPTTLEEEFFYSLPDGDECRTIDILNYITKDEMYSEKYKEYMDKLFYLYNITAYITNSKGEKFEMTVGPSENGSKYINEEGIMKFEAMYDLTRYSATDVVTVHIDYNGAKEEIVLEKKEEQ